LDIRGDKNGRVRSFVRERRFDFYVWRGSIVRRFGAPEEVVSITGTVGKTSATNMINAILAKRGKVHLGVDANAPRPVSQKLARLPWRCKYWVQEASGSYPGQLAKCDKFMRSTVSVVTTVTGDHIKAFKDLDEVAIEKGSIASRLPKDGLAVLNADDPRVLAIRDRCRCRVVTYGQSEEADIRILDWSDGLPDTLRLTVTDGSETREIRTQLAGNRWLVSIAAAIATTRSLGVPLAEICDTLEGFEPYLYRDSIHRLPDGSYFVLDCFKNAITSFESSMEVVRDSRSPRKIVIVGTLSGYRGAASSKYRNVARQALEVADVVCFYGKQSKHVRKIIAEFEGRLHMFDDVFELNSFIEGARRPNDLIYVKSTKADHLERLWHDREEPISCWVEYCGRETVCPYCDQLRGDRVLGRGLEHSTPADAEDRSSAA